MASKLDIPLHGSSVTIVRQCDSFLSDVLQSKFGCVVTISGIEFEGDSQLKGPKVVPEKRLKEMLVSGVKVSVWKADLTTFSADAVVNAANERLKHCGGLALALSKAGGPQIQEESDDYIKKHHYLKTGEAIIMDAGLLPCKKIIHVVGPHVPKYVTVSDGSLAQKQLQRAIWNSLERAKVGHLKTVAIPAVSSGLFGYPLPQCADTIVSTVKKFCEELTGSHCLKEIMLVNNDELTVREMERACNKILASHPSMGVTTNKRMDTKTSTVTVQVGNVHLTLKMGCIEDEQTDVIVNTTAQQNWRSGQISNAVLLKAGRELEEELNNALIKGNVIITKAHKLQCKEVYHTFLSDIHHGAYQILQDSVSECLRLAASNFRQSIAFPALGTGGLSLSKEQVAQIMSDAVVNFTTMSTMRMEVFFVIHPSDNETYKAFKERMTCLLQQASDLSFTHVHEHQDDFRHSRASTPQISLSGPSEEATRNAEKWLSELLFKSSGSVHIYNNFITHFSEQEHQQLSQLMYQKCVTIWESLERGRASITVRGALTNDVVVAVLQVEAMLCNIQREFILEEERALFHISNMELSFETNAVDYFTPEFSDMLLALKPERLWIVKVVRVENATLKLLFDLKKKQLGCLTSRTMFQCIPAQFCEMVSHVGFHAECAPPDDPAYGEGIYFAGTVKKAMEVWKKQNLEYVHLVVAEVLTGNSTLGRPGLILPPPVGTEPLVLYDSVSGGNDISVIFSGYQALPRYIITCKNMEP